MQTGLEVPCETWLKPIVDLLGEGEFSEAYALAAYFPNTHNRELVQFAALLGQKKIRAANTLLEKFSGETQSLVTNFINLLRQVDLNLLETAYEAIKNQHFELGDFCLEFQLLAHPETSLSVVDGLLRLAAQMLIGGNFERGRAYIEKVIKLDNSPTRLIQCAEVLLVNNPKRKKKKAFLRYKHSVNSLASDLIHQSLNQLDESEEDVDNKLKIAELFALHLQNLKKSRELLIEVIQSENNKQIADVLFSLVQKDLYIKPIIYFLLDSTNNLPLIEQLARNFLQSQDFSYQDKALSLLTSINPSEKENRSLFTKALLKLDPSLDILESYAKRLVNLEVSSDSYLEVAQALIKNETRNHQITILLLEKAFRSDPKKTKDILPIYIQPLIEQLARDFLHFQDFSYQDKALLLLTSINPGEKENRSLFTKALLKLDPSLDILESYAKRLVNLEVSSDSYLEVAQALIKNETRNHQITILLLEKVFRSDPEKKEDILPIYIQLVQLADEQNELMLFLNRYSIKDLISDEELLREIERLKHKKNIEDKFFNIGISFGTSISNQVCSSGDSEINISDNYIGGKSRKKITIERHTRIEFPSECILEQKVELKIQLTQEIPKSTRVQEKIALTVGLNTKQVKLNVKVTAPAFAISSYQQELIVPVEGDSNEVTFTLFPIETGEKVIEIEFFKGATRVGYVLVPTYVCSYSYDKSPPKVLSMEDPINGLKNLENMTVNPDKHTLNVTWIERESKLLYTIFPANRLGEWEKTIPNIQEKIEDDLRNLNAFLTEVVQQGNPSDERWDSICFNLQGVGSNLFEMLIPSEVAKQMRTWKIGSPVIISTNEQWIPWELMYDGEDFWGKKFIIARSPRLSDNQDLPDKSRPESKGERQIKRIVNIVGGDVPSSEAERASHLFSTFLPSAGQWEVLEQGK